MPIIREVSIQFTFIIIFSALFFGCGLFLPCNEFELKRIASPDDQVEAVLVKKDCGATTSESLNVFIVNKGGKTEEKDLVFQADHIMDFSLSWRKAKFLEMRYRQGRIFQFTNFWQSKDVDNFSYVVEIRETPLSQSHVLSASDRWEK